jgi:hypothetical protein
MIEQTFGGLLWTLMSNHILTNDYGWVEDVKYVGRGSDIMTDMLDTFEVYSGFLDAIPREDWGDIIEGTDKEDGLIRMLLRYSRKSSDLEMREEYPGRKRPLDGVRRDTKTIQDFYDLVSELYNQSEGGDLPYKDDISTALDVAAWLIDDLENKRFEIFPRWDYYEWEVKTKTEISDFLDALIAKYDLKGCSLDKDELISNLSS